MTGRWTPLAGGVDAAVRGSFLARLREDVRRELLSDATLVQVPAGTTFMRQSEAAEAAVIVSGLARVFLASSEGRQVTVRYAAPTSVVGVAALVETPNKINVQALQDCTVLRLNADAFRRVGERESGVAWEVARELSNRYHDILDELTINTFGDVRQRLARHLIDLAAERQEGRHLVVHATQQELADAVGTSRDVAGRAVRELRDEGLIKIGAEGIILLDPVRLHLAAHAARGRGRRTTKVTQGIDKSR